MTWRRLRAQLPGAWLLVVLLAGWMLAGWMLAAAQMAVPPLLGHVTDQTGTLTANQRATLGQTLAARIEGTEPDLRCAPSKSWRSGTNAR